LPISVHLLLTGAIVTTQPQEPAAAAPAGRKQYNAGSEDDLRKALDAISDYIKTLITIATGSVALSATFLANLYHGRAISVLVSAWSVLGISVVFGLVAIGEVIAQLAESSLRPRRGALEYLALLQLLALLAGLALFAWFAVSNVTAKN